MTMNEISKEQHSYANQSYLLDQTIDKAVDLLAEKAEPFNCTKTVGDHTLGIGRAKQRNISSWTSPAKKAQED